MSPLTFGGTPIPGTRAMPQRQQPSAPDAAIAAPDMHMPDRVTLFLALIGMALEARRELQNAVDDLREIDIDALNDPALMDHPRRPAMLQHLEACEAAERDATRRVIETNVNLQRTWERIDPADKHRYGLTFIVGEMDPVMNILGDLWCDDRGLALLVPWPDGWAVPHALEHRCFDTTTGMRTYTIEEVMRREHAPF